MIHDRASIFARTLLQTVARHIVDEPDGTVALRVRVAEQLREEFHAIRQQTINEIRPEDE